MAGKRLLPTPSAPELGYVQCEWTDGSNRCRFPGSRSSSTGNGSWFCTAHFDCRDPLMGATIVQASMDYRHQTPEERYREHHGKAEAYALALGLKTTAERRAWFRRQVSRLAEKMRPSYAQGGGLDAARKALGDQDPVPLARDLDPADLSEPT